MTKAFWNGTIIAESDACETVEGNAYFPPDSVYHEYLVESQTRTVCGWKGTASYFNLVVGSETNPDAAWTYPEPKEAAANIAGYIAFWNGVEVE